MKEEIIIKLSAAEAVKQNLTFIKEQVHTMPGIDGNGLEIPDYDILYAAADKLDESPTAVDDMFVIKALLGRAADLGSKKPNTTDKPVFPAAHSIDPNIGTEWYWVGITLKAKDAKGNTGEIGILLSMQKYRTLGNVMQQIAKWTDKDNMLFYNLATVTLNFPGNQKIIRRSPNKQWGIKNGVLGYNKPGENFNFYCGNDSLAGSVDVLPLKIIINDGDNMTFQLTLKPRDGVPAANAFFLQGVPDSQGKGTGKTPEPKPGVYYSWPQVQVDVNNSSAIKVANETYTIVSGIAWIDHQVMVPSMENANNSQRPLPFEEDPIPLSGWTWQYFNLANGEAFTCSSFVKGALDTGVSIPYGYYIKPTSDGWDSSFVVGYGTLEGITTFETPGSPNKDITYYISISNKRTYMTSNLFPSSPTSSEDVATANSWIADGTFFGSAFDIGSENPANYSNNSSVAGQGFLESIAFESVIQYRARMLKCLQTGEYPDPFKPVINS